MERRRLWIAGDGQVFDFFVQRVGVDANLITKQRHGALKYRAQFGALAQYLTDLVKHAWFVLGAFDRTRIFQAMAWVDKWNGRDAHNAMSVPSKYRTDTKYFSPRHPRHKRPIGPTSISPIARTITALPTHG